MLCNEVSNWYGGIRLVKVKVAVGPWEGWGHEGRAGGRASSR